MGRPTASKENKQFAVAVAKLVTMETGSPMDMIARSGQCSLYHFLKGQFPWIVRDGHFGVRDGVSEVELNKTLQVICTEHYLEKKMSNPMLCTTQRFITISLHSLPSAA
jgi:hypothetical protein